MKTAVVSYPGRRAAGSSPRGLIWTLIRTDFKTRYHGTILGFVWALLKPLTMFLVLMSVFSMIFSTEQGYRINLIIGLFVWDFFAQATNVGLTSLFTKGYLLTKARFPSWIVVVTSISNAVITLGVSVLIIVGALVVSGRAPAPWAIALFLWYLLHFVVIVIGFSLATSVLYLRYRDLNQVWDVIIQAGFFAAPIVYPLNILPVHVHYYLYFWPPTPVIQFARLVLVDGVPPTFKAHLFLSMEAIAVLLVGMVIFRRYAPSAIEQI
jgi:lipopolysaccharide transport system permease protein